MKRGVVLIFYIFSLTMVLGQPGGSGLPGDPPPNPIPISGVAILLGIGSVIGIRKFLKRDKTS